MKQVRKLLTLWVASTATLLLYQNCSGGFSPVSLSAIAGSSATGGSGSSTATPTITPADYFGKNTFPVQVTGTCSMDGFNGPCVSVTVCSPGTSNCLTINNVLLDTGSTGLRIYKSLLGGLAFSQVNAPSGNPLGECYEYGDGTYGFWGSIQRADVRLGGETASNVPIQIVDPSFDTVPTTCQIGSLDTPSDSGINGILGINQFVQDCGADCASSTGAELYYSCTSSSCTETTVSLPNQAPNPISMMPFDNNGLIIQLPTISTVGSGTTSGLVTMGIGTQANNMTSSVSTTVTTDDGGFFETNFNGVTYPYALVDSGTPAYDMPSSSTLIDCSGNGAPFFCPTSTQNLTAEMMNISNANQGQIPFQIVSASTLNSSYVSFDNVGWDNGGVASPTTTTYIWGLPFFFGRSVYIGIEGKASSLATGSYVAF